jgi:diguanylate cyclase (GGDEF)-like protein
MAEVRGREKRLEEAVILDEGTGLCNRHFFLRQLKTELRRARKSDGVVAVAVLDVDEFTRFNETFGYAAGNRMIKALADEMASVVAEGADADPDLVTLCRWGGEEFALVVPGEPPASTDEHAFDRRVRRLTESLRRHVAEVRVQDMGVTVSVGVAVFPFDGATVDGLMDSVDQAVMAACETGGDRVVFAAESQAAS